jgi:hypothetical protein
MDNKVKKTIKVKALTSLVKIGYAYQEGDVFELKTQLANEFIQDGYVEKCGK